MTNYNEHITIQTNNPFYNEISENTMKDNMMIAFCASKPDRIEKISIPIPEPNDYEVLVKNEACAP